MSQKLIEEYPLILLPSLAKAIGVNEAIALQQLHFYLSNKKCGVIVENQKWIYNTYEQWQEEFCFWSIRTIQRVFLSLEKMGIVISIQPDRAERRKYYRINYQHAKLASCQDGALQGAKLAPSHASASNQSETTTENTPLPPEGGEAGAEEENPEPPAQMELLPKTTTPKVSKLPTSEPALRIAALFSRRNSTEWSDKEIKAYRKLHPVNLDDFITIEAYYASERAKGSEGIHRRDLSTFLNNYYGELDRARAWQSNKGKPKQAQINGHQSAQQKFRMIA